MNEKKDWETRFDVIFVSEESERWNLDFASQSDMDNIREIKSFIRNLIDKTQRDERARISKLLSLNIWKIYSQIFLANQEHKQIWRQL